MPALDDRNRGLFLFGVFVSMLLGMIAKTVHEHITTGIDFQWQRFVLPLLVSPIVYGVVFQTAKGSNERVMMLIFGFQNGFFWQDVLTGIPGPQTASP